LKYELMPMFIAISTATKVLTLNSIMLYTLLARFEIMAHYRK